jgi:hypothetical protein
MGFRDKCNRVIIDFYVADFKKKHTPKTPTNSLDRNGRGPQRALTDRFQSRQGSDRKRLERSFRSHVVRTSSVSNSSRMTRVIGENPGATIILDLPLVGAQDRMTEVRRKIRREIADDRLGRALGRKRVVSTSDIGRTRRI